MGDWTPRQLTPAQREERRRAAARLLRGGRYAHAEIARRFGVSATTVSRWAAALARHGVAGLARRPHTGRPARMTERQWARLLRQLAKGAVAAGFDTERWTLRRIAQVIERDFGVRYHFRSLGPLLRRHGWSPQVPAVRAAERDEALIGAWLRRDWPAVKRGLVAQGQSLPSWTRRVTRFGPPSAPRGRRAAAPPSCVA